MQKEKSSVSQIKKYRLGYDYLFLTHKPIRHKGDVITAVALNVIIDVTDKNGNRVIFQGDELKDQSLNTENGEKFWLSELLICKFDEETLYNFEVNIPLFRVSGLTSISWVIHHFSKDIESKEELFNLPVCDVIEIPENEFVDIMRSNLNLFDNIDNISAQTTSYFTEEV